MVQLGLTEAAAATDVAFQKKIFGSGTILVFLNKEIDDIMIIVEALEKSDLLINSVSDAVEIEAKEQKGGFTGTLASTLGSISLGNMLPGKEEVRGGGRVIRVGEAVVRAAEEQDFNAASSFS